MLKSFLLLQNNQQSGPFTQEELMHLPLKPKDLVWIIGESAGWCFPEELNLLENSIQQQTVVSPIISIIEKNTASLSEVTSISKEDTEVRHIYVSLPAKTNNQTVSNPVPVAEESTPSFEERVEKMRQRVAAVNTGAVKKEEPAIDTKYSRSLEDIKEEYSSWLQAQKKPRSVKIETKHIGVAALLIVALSGSFWAAKYFLTRPVLQAGAIKEVMPSFISPTVASSQVSATTRNGFSHPEENVQPVQQLLKSNKKKSINQSITPLITQGRTVSQRTMEQPVAKTVSLSKEQTPSPSVAAQQAAPIADQIDIKAEILPSQNQNGMSGIAISVKNNSNQSMKVIAVDVVYYGDGMKELDRKTLYFSNVAPGEVLTLQAPAHKKADSAYAQLGLISSEGGSIFYAANQ